MKEDNSPENNELYEFGPFLLDTAERRLLRDNNPVPLTRKGFDLLLLLVASAGHLMTRESLIEALWPNTVVEEQGLTTLMYGLRKALGDNGSSPAYIETERGIGYRFMAEVKIRHKSRSPAGGTTQPERRPDAEAGHSRRHRRVGLAGAAVLVLAVVAVLSWWFVDGKAPANSPPPSAIAVLPFENLSAESHDAYIAAGIRDTILTHLAQLNTFHVISRTASDHYGSHPDNLARLAHELDINSVLEGSVQKRGPKVMINVQLIDAQTHSHIWAATYTRKLESLFKVESAIATKVATALRHKLHPAQLTQLAKPPTHDSQAYLLYLQANYHAHQAFDFASTKTPGKAVARADKLYRQALARDPEFALAWARLSLLDIKAYWFGVDYTAERKGAAEQAAKRAVELAPGLAEAHIARGYALYYGKRDFPAALGQFEIARKTLPYDADVVGAIAYIHRRQGSWQKALRGLRRAHELDPRNPLWPYETGVTFMALRRYKESIQQFNEALAIAPNDYDAKVHKVYSLLLSGKMQQARRQTARIPDEANPQGFVSSLRFELAWLSRQPDKALEILDNAPNWRPYQSLRARIWALKGNEARARAAYKKNSEALRKKLRDAPQNPGLWSALGLAEAGLGHQEKAMEAGRRATELYPLAEDAVAGPRYLAQLAEIHARLGDAKTATRLLDKLLGIPAGVQTSVAMLRENPVWDPIRESPDFQALLKKYADAAPAE